MIQIKNLCRQVTHDFNLQNIDLEIPQSSILTLLGKSGSGKSTLLRCIAGLETYQTESESKPAGIGFVFQSSNLFSHLTLADNIKLSLIKVQKKNAAEAERICHDVLEQVKLAHRKDYLPSRLSGGQQQRGAIARALALKPQLILYDEPTSALDPELVDELFELMLELKKTGITQIVATHETTAVRKISDYIGYMSHGQMRLFETLKNAPSKLKDLELEEQKYLQLFI
ncbi:MAG: ATP-binding cassette domain-containing protein [Bdellovibrionaceae bacterium]|nr:ATP-binding cassette domain-containing protein [Pseudobdellovibrionaceae bacterium]